MAGERLEVLDDGGEVELVACPGETPQAHTLEAVMGFEVRKSHLDLLALVARLFELWRTHEAAGMIAGILMDVACDLARGRVRTALQLEWTCAAVAPRCTIAHLVFGARVAGGLEQLVGGTGIDVTFAMKGEVAVLYR